MGEQNTVIINVNAYFRVEICPVLVFAVLQQAWWGREQYCLPCQLPWCLRRALKPRHYSAHLAFSRTLTLNTLLTVIFWVLRFYSNLPNSPRWLFFYWWITFWYCRQNRDQFSGLKIFWECGSGFWYSNHKPQWKGRAAAARNRTPGCHWIDKSCFLN